MAAAADETERMRWVRAMVRTVPQTVPDVLSEELLSEESLTGAHFTPRTPRVDGECHLTPSTEPSTEPSTLHLTRHTPSHTLHRTLHRTLHPPPST